jgi:hypothetical protein
MDPQSALDYQLALYRQMTGERRLEIALGLHELACNVTRDGIRAQHPDFDEEAVEAELRRRIMLSRTL